MCYTAALGFRLTSGATAGVSIVQGLFIEVFLTAQLMITIFLVGHSVFFPSLSVQDKKLTFFVSGHQLAVEKV